MSDSSHKDIKTLYLIDGHAQIFRAYHAIRSLSSPVTKEPTNATFGFVGMLIKLFRECKPDYVVVTIDASGDHGTFRSQLYPDYKANRDAPPEDLHPQTERIVEICQMWGIPVYGVEGVEADDTIATICRQLADQPDVKIRIVSRDKDLEQLLGERVEMYDVHKDTLVTVADLLESKGIAPDQVVDVLALMGDKVDNVIGVNGVGPKTAAKLIAQYESLDAVVRNVDELSGKLQTNIREAADRLPLNKALVQLKDDVSLEFDLEAAAVTPAPVEKLGPMFKQLGFSRHLRDLEDMLGSSTTTAEASAFAETPSPSKRKSKTPQDDGFVGGLFDGLDGDASDASSNRKITAANAENYQIVRTRKELDAIVKTIRKTCTNAETPLAVDTETDQLNPMQCNLCGISFSWEPKQGVYIPIRSPKPDEHLDETIVVEVLRSILESSDIPKAGQNLKYDIIVLRRAGIQLAGTIYDSMVAAYLIDATRSSYKLDNLTLAYLDYEMIPISDLIGTGKNQRSMLEIPLEDVAVYAAEDTDVVLQLKEKFDPFLRDLNMVELFNDLESPLVPILAELEYNGIRCEPDELDRQKRELEKRIGELHDEVIRLAGVSFNLDSPKQLADILFNQLGCKVVKRKKTGPSTDSEVLLRIANEQPPPGSVVAELILEYRQLAKLKGTYLESLKIAIDPDTGRIHASFNQTGAATGRLSSSSPNLQNIPIRTELGRQIRKAFVAEEGSVLLAADYSQIELRLLAHLSQDQGLMDAFTNDLDIHTAVAAEVFNVDIDHVTSEQRSTAKMVNFGIVYGITPYGLARRLPADAAGSSVDIAKQIIADYKTRYPKIDEFLAQCVQMAELNGYVETLCKRRRAIPQIESENANTAAFGRRIAINTVVQGSAADLIKTAMIQIHQRIADEGRPMKMLLQIHDELVFEVPEENVETEAEVVRQIMSDAMPLSVPLKVDVKWGRDWYDAK